MTLALRLRSRAQCLHERRRGPTDRTLRAYSGKGALKCTDAKALRSRSYALRDLPAAIRRAWPAFDEVHNVHYPIFQRQWQ